MAEFNKAEYSDINKNFEQYFKPQSVFPSNNQSFAPPKEANVRMDYNELLKTVTRMNSGELKEFKQQINKIEVANRFNQSLETIANEPNMKILSVLCKVDGMLVSTDLVREGENIYVNQQQGSAIILVPYKDVEALRFQQAEQAAQQNPEAE